VLLIDTRRLLLLGTLLAPAGAQAWEQEELGPVSLEAPVLGVGLLPVEGGHPMVLALGGQVTWLVDPSNAEDVRTLPIGGRDVALLGLDGRAHPHGGAALCRGTRLAQVDRLRKPMLNS